MGQRLLDDKDAKSVTESEKVSGNANPQEITCDVEFDADGVERAHLKEAVREHLKAQYSNDLVTLAQLRVTDGNDTIKCKLTLKLKSEQNEEVVRKYVVSEEFKSSVRKEIDAIAQ